MSTARKTKTGLGAAGAALIGADRTPKDGEGGSPGGGSLVDALQQAQRTQSGVVDGLDQWLIEVPIEKVVGHPENPREDLGDLEGLVESIRRSGILQPPLVWPAESFLTDHPHLTMHVDLDGYVISAGHRRHAAAVRAGLSTIPVIVRPSADRVDAYVRFIDENTHRLGLSALEEARGYALLSDAGLPQRSIAGRLGVSQGQVSRRLGLLRLPEAAQDALRASVISLADALALVSVPVADQQAVWDSHERNWWGLKGAVDRYERARKEKAAVALARAEAVEAGVTVIDSAAVEFGTRAGDHRLYDSESIENARADGTLCAVPSEHGLQYYTTTGPTGPTTDDRAAENRRERKRAMQARTEAAQRMVQTPPTPAEAARDLARVVLRGNLQHSSAMKLVHQWLRTTIHVRGVELDADKYAWFEGARQLSERHRLWVAWSMAVAAMEDHARWEHNNRWNSDDIAYLELLKERAGYDPTPWETKRIRTSRQETR